MHLVVDLTDSVLFHSHYLYHWYMTVYVWLNKPFYWAFNTVLGNYVNKLRPSLLLDD